GPAMIAIEPAAGLDEADPRGDGFDLLQIGGAHPLNDETVDSCRVQRWPAPICATALISTFSNGVAKAATCTSVEAGKLPVKNSRRACHTFSRWLMSVTKIVTVVISAIVPPAASTR